MLHKFIDSFRVEDLIEKQVYQLFLLIIYCIHNVFHVFYLKSYMCHNDDTSVLSLQPSELINNEEKYKIEEILEK